MTVTLLKEAQAVVDGSRIVDLQRSDIDSAALMRPQAAGRDFRNVEDVIAWSRSTAS
jgi:hypothetical protein